MKSSVQQLNFDLQTLRAEIDLGPILGSAIEATHADNPVLKTQLTIRSRRMAYVHGIVSIYGLLEEHVDNLIMEVANAYPRLYSRYSDLPESVRSSHRECSLRVLLDGEKARLREPINEVSSLSVLAADYNDTLLQLNSSAFTYSTANYRHPYIADLMRRLNLDITNLVAASSVRQALTDSGLEFRDVASLLDDIVERRNEIVHSYHPAFELLEVGVLSAYLDVVAAYLRELFSIASNHLMLILASQHLKPIGDVVKRWTMAVGVDMKDGRIQAPCTVMFIKAQRVFIRVVSSLQSGGTPLEGPLEYAGELIQLGMSINEVLPQAAEGSQAYVLPDQWLYLSI